LRHCWLLLAVLLPLGALAQETRLLSDFSVDGEWKVHPWNKAKGSLAPSEEFPASLVTEPGVPRRSLAATIDWPGGKEFAFFNMDAPSQPPIPFKVLGVSLWVKGTGTGHFIEVHLKGADGKPVKVGLPPMDFTDWRKLRKEVPADAAQPLTLNCITIHNWGLPYRDKTRLHVTRLEVLADTSQRLVKEGATQLFSVDAIATNGLIGDDGKARFAVKLMSWQPGKKLLEIRQSWTEWSGAKTEGKTLQVALEGSWQQAVEIDVPRFGPISYTAELWEPGGAKAQTVMTKTLVKAVPVPKLTPEQRLRSPMGVNGHWQSPWGTLARLGIHWGRDYSWGWLEHGQKAPMAPNGVDFRTTLKSAEDAGVILLPITMRSFWDKGQNRFIEDEAAIATAFTRLGKAFPSIPYWELDNEADLATPNHRLDLANYSKLIRAAAKGLREAGKARVALNGTSGIHYRDTLDLLKSPVRDDFAVVNYHYYTGTAPPEVSVENVNTGGSGGSEPVSFLDQLRRINRASHAAGKETWLTEIGWDVTYGQAVGERLQAIYLPRAYLLARWCGTDQVYWFFDRDVKDSTTKFASCGLVTLDNLVRPSGAAMAALSLHTATAEPAGSVDVGEGRWCLLFKKPEGGWVATAWSLSGEYPLPKELESARAFDLFGNPLANGKLTPEVAYFHLDALPPAWEGQRTVEWLSPTTLIATQGGTVLAEAAAGEAKLAWEGLPKGAEASAWKTDGKKAVSTLTCQPALAIGSYPIRAIAEGNGWKRTWDLTLRVGPAVLAKTPPFYLPGAPARIELRAAGEDAQSVTLSLPKDAGVVEPASLTLEPGKPSTVTFTPAAVRRTANGVVPIILGLKNGVNQKLPLRPRDISLPRITREGEAPAEPFWPDRGGSAGASPSRWPAAAKLAQDCVATSDPAFAPEVALAWSPAGLWIAAKLSIQDLKAGDPKWFWECTCIELFLDSDTEGDGRKTAHQFWFTPVRDEKGWRLYAGEWKRTDAIAETIYDDKRCKTLVQVAGKDVSFEAFIPKEALGIAALAPGRTLRAAVAIQRIEPTGTTAAGWPILKSGGILNSPSNWGILRLSE